MSTWPIEYKWTCLKFKKNKSYKMMNIDSLTVENTIFFFCLQSNKLNKKIMAYIPLAHLRVTLDVFRLVILK